MRSKVELNSHGADKMARANQLVTRILSRGQDADCDCGFAGLGACEGQQNNQGVESEQTAADKNPFLGSSRSTDGSE